MIPFEKLPDEYIKKAKEYAPAFAQAKVYKEKLKQFLAVLMSEHIRKGESASKAEALAKCDPRYIEKLDEVQKTLLTAEIGRAGLKSMDMAFEYYRSMNSLKKKEINMT